MIPDIKRIKRMKPNVFTKVMKWRRGGVKNDEQLGTLILSLECKVKNVKMKGRLTLIT